MPHVIVAADGPIAPVGPEQQVERVAAVRRAAVVGVGPARTSASRRGHRDPAADHAPGSGGPRAHPRRAREHRHPPRRGARRSPAAHRHPAQLEDRQVEAVGVGRPDPRGREARRTMIVLVTGASGFLGRAVAAELVAAGHDVRTLQRRASGVDGASDILGTITDPRIVARATDGADGVVHLAAKVSLAGRPEEFRAVNVEGTRTVLDAAERAGVSRFVQVSSPSVAHSGSALAGVGAEPADPRHARGEYARTKAEAELIALARDSPSMHVVAVRPAHRLGAGRHAAGRARRRACPRREAAAARRRNGPHRLDLRRQRCDRHPRRPRPRPGGARPGVRHHERRTAAGGRSAGRHLPGCRRATAAMERAGMARPRGRLRDRAGLGDSARHG